jgi:hypothetical protein
MTDFAAVMGAAPPAEKPDKPPRKRAVGKRRELAAGYGKKKKVKKRKAKVAKAAPKRTPRNKAIAPLSLEAATALMGALHRTDLETFQQMSSLMAELGIPARRRVLGALGKVFDA